MLTREADRVAREDIEEIVGLFALQSRNFLTDPVLAIHSRHMRLWTLVYRAFPFRFTAGSATCPDHC